MCKVFEYNQSRKLFKLPRYYLLRGIYRGRSPYTTPWISILTMCHMKSMKYSLWDIEHINIYQIYINTDTCVTLEPINLYSVWLPGRSPVLINIGASH